VVFVYTDQSVCSEASKSEKHIPHPAEGAGIRDDKVVRNGTWTGESVAPTALGALLHLVPSPYGLG
jgi:hypothetical protein